VRHPHITLDGVQKWYANLMRAHQKENYLFATRQSAGDYNFFTNNCSTVCVEGLKALGINIDAGFHNNDPDDAWDQLFQTYGDPSIPVFPVWHYPAQPGREYGFQRYPGINTYQLSDLYFRLFLYQGQKQPKACVTTTDSLTGTTVTTPCD
jgi:hypothetical protein